MGRHDAPAVCPRCLPPPSFPSPFSFSGSHIYCLGDSAKPPFDPSCVCSAYHFSDHYESHFTVPPLALVTVLLLGNVCWA